MKLENGGHTHTRSEYCNYLLCMRMRALLLDNDMQSLKIIMIYQYNWNEVVGAWSDRQQTNRLL